MIFQFIYIPDKVFKEYLLSLCDIDGDGEISVEEAELITEIKCSDISSLEGIQHLRNLEYLDCSNSLLQTLDISCNQSLKYLDCRKTQLKSLDLSQNTQIDQFYSDKLDSIIIGNNTRLLAVLGVYCIQKLRVVSSKTSVHFSNTMEMEDALCKLVKEQNIIERKLENEGFPFPVKPFND